METEMKSENVNPEDVASLSIEEFVQILQKNGCKSASLMEIRKQITDGGAPTNEDGTIDLIRYAVWLLK